MEIFTEKDLEALENTNEFSLGELPPDESAMYILLGSLWNGKALTSEENEKLISYNRNLIKSMESGPLHYDTQAIVDSYVMYLCDKEVATGITPEESAVVQEYNAAVAKIRETKKAEEEKLIVEGKNKTLKLSLENNTRGAIISIVVLETTILLGILISFLALAKR